MNIVTDFTIFQIWMLIFNGWVRISVFLCNGFPFEYTRQRNINPLLCNVNKQNPYFLGNEYCQLLRFLRNEIVATIYNHDRRCSISGPDISALRGGSQQPEPVTNSQVSYEKSARVGCQRSRQKTSKDCSKARYWSVRTQCN
jgi:hypothetical protein